VGPVGGAAGMPPCHHGRQSAAGSHIPAGPAVETVAAQAIVTGRLLGGLPWCRRGKQACAGCWACWGWPHGRRLLRLPTTSVCDLAAGAPAGAGMCLWGPPQGSCSRLARRDGGLFIRAHACVGLRGTCGCRVGSGRLHPAPSASPQHACCTTLAPPLTKGRGCTLGWQLALTSPQG
jgi:hypothetical protein